MAQTNWLYGDDSCAYGSVDCNRCAPDVESQFQDMIDGSVAWHKHSWTFDWGQHAAPSNNTPNQAWDASLSQEYTFHAQGFVRINNGGVIKYAMSHSDDDVGSVSFVANIGVGSNFLWAMHRTSTSHPSGLFTLGRYVGLVDGTDLLRLYDGSTAAVRTFQDISYSVDPSAGGPGLRTGNGGIAAAKLFGGGYVVAVGEGGAESGNHDQDTDIYFLDGPLTAPQRKEHLGTLTGHNESENLSVITECGTRNIYVVHMSGDDPGLQGFYSLSRIDWDSSGPFLVHRLTYSVLYPTEDIDVCHHRSAASVSVRADGTIDLECHERAQDGFGSDSWDFREGINYGP